MVMMIMIVVATRPMDVARLSMCRIMAMMSVWLMMIMIVVATWTMDMPRLTMWWIFLGRFWFLGIILA